MMEQPNQLAKIFKALGDENRLRILGMLQGQERCACMLLDEMHITPLACPDGWSAHPKA